MGNNYETCAEILKLWIAFGKTKKDAQFVEAKQFELIQHFSSKKLYEEAC